MPWAMLSPTTAYVVFEQFPNAAHRDVYVAYNRIHGAKKYFHDGGAIYNLSGSPGTVIAENHIFDNGGRPCTP